MDYINDLTIKWKNNAAYVGLGLITTLFSCEQEKTRKVESPNILLIITDDQGGPWTTSFTSGPNANTPNLDKLASEGVVILNSFSQGAHCSPARAALISGRYASETDVITNVGADNPIGVDTSLVLWPELFSKAGYKTAMVGKWHIGEAYDYFHPESRGFQKFSGFLRAGEISRDPVVRVEGKDTIYKGEYTPDVLTNLTMDYISEFKGSPWIISLNYWAPHANTRFPDDFKPPHRGRSWLPMREDDLEYWKDLDLVLPEPDFPNLDVELLERYLREYHASVHSVDRNVGRLMQLLEDLNLDENTIIIFTSDHGYMMGQHGLWHKGNGRWLTKDGSDPRSIYSDNRPNLFDLSLRVPLIIRWPGQIEKGSAVEETVRHIDLYPTLLEMAGIDKPDDLLLRGNSVVPLLKGLDIPSWDNTFFAQYLDLRCIQTPQWKYVHDFADSKNEFYNLYEDPGEKNNLIYSTEPTILRKMVEIKELLFKKLEEIEDPILKE